MSEATAKNNSDLLKNRILLTAEMEELRSLLYEIEVAESFANAETALLKISRLIGLPVVAWSPDISVPLKNTHVDAFMRRNGWSEETINLWWDRAVMLKHPICLSCRINPLPIVSDMTENSTTGLDDVRKLNANIVNLGARSSITIPIRYSRGQVGILFFGGAKDTDETHRLLAEIKTELIATGLYFMNAYLKEFVNDPQRQESLWQLTPKQWQCLRLSAQGFRETEIAEILGIVTPTVRYHLKNAATNIGASTRTHAVAIAAQLGILGPISI